jgi:multidrug efflux pump subunit AcrB
MPSPKTRFNLAAWLAQQFIESQLVIILIIGFLLFGLLGLFFTPREENPQIIVPAAEVVVTMPGAEPLEVEHLLLTPLEGRLSAIDGVKHTYGIAAEGVAKIQVEFEVGKDKTQAVVRLYDQVLRFRADLPPNAGEPYIRVIDVDEVPMMTVTLASAQYSEYELGRMAERMVERLRSLKGVGQSEVVGAQPREIRLQIDPARLQGFNLSLDTVRQVVQGANLSLLLGHQVHQGETFHLRVDNLLTQVSEIKNLILRSDGEKIVRLQDVADVIDAPPTERTQMVRFSFGPADSRFAATNGMQMAAISIAIAKQPGVNSVPLALALRERVKKMQTNWLPQDVHVVITRDDGDKANKTVNLLVEHLFIAIGCVSLIFLLFLGWRAALIVTVTIPLVFAVVMGADWLAGPTLNRITLYALILALGMLVDDAIVVIENIHRHYQHLPEDADIARRSQIAVLATGEIGNPTTLATLTVVTVFLSLIMVTGMLGQYFYPMTFNVPVAMIASLFIAYCITPWAARRFLPTGKHHQAPKSSWLQIIYRFLFNLLFRYRLLRYLFFLLIIVLLGLSMLQPAWQFIRPEGLSGATSKLGVPLAFLPKDNKNTFLITFHHPEATPLEVTDRSVRLIEAELAKNPYVTNYQSFIGIPSVIDFNGQLRGSSGRVGSQFAEIRVNLTDKAHRSITSIDIVHQFRVQIADILAHYSESSIQLVEDPPGPPVRATVLAELYGPDNVVLENIAMQQVSPAFFNTYDMAEVWASVPTPIPEYRLVVDREKANLVHLSAAQVASALNRFIAGEVLGYIHVKGERTPVPIRLHIPREQRIEPTLLAQAFVTNPQGKQIPLSELTQVVLTKQPHPIWHQDNERVIYVGGELAASAPVYAVLAISPQLDGLDLGEHGTLRTTNLGFNPTRPDSLEGYRLHWAGELRLTLDAFRDMGMALGLALIAIYLLLVAYYQSFTTPILVMVSVPLGLIGVFPGHWLLGQNFSAASMIGVIALAGIVVRNSLLIVDFAREHQQKGWTREQSVREAGALRLQPILLTTLAIVLGTAIMVPDPVFGGLAISLIFGAMSSALLTVFVVPLLYR